jgi:hypothetical protein
MEVYKKMCIIITLALYIRSLKYFKTKSKTDKVYCISQNKSLTFLKSQVLEYVQEKSGLLYILHIFHNLGSIKMSYKRFYFMLKEGG